MTRRHVLASAAASAAVQRAEAAPDRDVIVVGAGAAGLAATQALRAAGLSVECVEARSRVGGRTFTDTTTFGVPVDRGAHWLHSRDRNPLVGIGRALGLSVYDAPDNFLLFDPEGQAIGTDALWQAYEDAEATIARRAREREDAPLSQVLRHDTLARQTAAGLIALSMARDLDDISAVDWHSAAGGPDSFCREGFGTLVAANHRETPVTLGVAVTALRVAGNRVEVSTADGTRSARACILTVPLGVLQAGTLRVDPAPETAMQSALGGFSMGTYNHCILSFDPGAIDTAADTWAMRELPAGAMPTGVLCNLSGHDICIVETSGNQGRALEEAGEAAMVEQAIEEVTAIFGTSARRGFRAASATRWSADPWTRGSYSGAFPGAAHLRARLRVPIADRLFLAGEMCHTGLQATVAGAHLDGLRAANAVIERLR